MSSNPSGATHRFARRSADVDAAFFLPYLRPGMELLDAGCGPGSITLGLAERVRPGAAVGIDLDEARIAGAEEDARSAGVGNATFRVADVLRLPFEDGRFDAVFANGLIEHLEDPATALAGMRRVLKPGGVIGVRSPDWGAALLHPDDAALRESIELRNRWQRARGGDPEAGRRLRQLLTSAGFAGVAAGASAESHGTVEGALEGARYMRSILRDPELVEKCRMLDWASGDDLLRMERAWETWAQAPGAFASFFWCHATGRAA